MVKKQIKYIDFDGNEREDTFYFNLTKAEILEMEANYNGLDRMLEQISDEKNMSVVLSVFKDLIGRAYGEKSDDGRRFIKSAEMSASFAATEAYSELLMELCTNADAASAFVNGLTTYGPAKSAMAPAT